MNSRLSALIFDISGRHRSGASLGARKCLSSALKDYFPNAKDRAKLERRQAESDNVSIPPKYTRLRDWPKRAIFNWKNLLLRDDWTCQYCGMRPRTGMLSVDHVVPRCQGGAHEWVNCVVACIPCNWRKGGRTPKQARMPLIRRPFDPSTSRSTEEEDDELELLRSIELYEERHVAVVARP